jgi:uncharacterized protein (TIGR03083 family)
MTPGRPAGSGPHYLMHLADESERFVEALADGDPRRPVPTCPDWNAADLVWHLAKVQWFWSRVVRDRPASPEQIDDLRPERPAAYPALLALAEQATADLVGALDSASPAEAAWSWSREQTVGFSCRRQAHEALIHRLDAELTTGRRSPMDAELCTDGVDEVIWIMLGGVPDGSEVEPHPPDTVRFTAADTGRQWFVTLGRARGVLRGQAYDEATFIPAEEDSGQPAAASITAIAEDLDCWLWNRPTRHQVDHHGDHDVLARVAALVREGIT